MILIRVPDQNSGRFPAAATQTTREGSASIGQPCSLINADPGVCGPFPSSPSQAAPIPALGYVDAMTMTVRPILTLSPFFSRWALYMRRPLSHVPLVELRSSTYQ